MPTIRELTPLDTHASARSLADAFGDDPLNCWMGRFNDDPTRLTPMFRWAITSRFRLPEPLMFTSEQHEATALWNAPGHADISPSEIVRALPALVRSLRFGMFRALRLLPIIDKAHPPEAHYYLFAIGVRHDRQGGGFGSAVIQPMLDRCDHEGVPAYLENSKPRNEAFYVRHGFEPRDALALPDGAPPIAPMWRSPR